MDLKSIAREVINTEIKGLEHVAENIDANFSGAVNEILSTNGRVIICGMGKSGIIGKKIAASFASTGTPSFFMHPGEAFHGDLGMVTPDDVFVAISYSGETDEVLKLLPFLRNNGNKIISITGKPHSTLSISSNFNLNVAVPKEACPLQLAPTTSTTATLVLGDALTVALMKSRGFKEEGFAKFHPGGSLGRKLLSKVIDEMITENLPIVNKTTTASDLIQIMTSSMQGLAIVCESNQLFGIVTDGDLRRAMKKFGSEVFTKKTEDICSIGAKTISPESSMEFAFDLMTELSVNSLIVTDNNTVVGILKK
ncbi:KpsF/GutQ family sugar-phosphate isomerase [Shewanella metallivivens]|uniref:Arabinose 5-phosphate isomerase n=1 Tax=Shewanella metallivivens TaxID=2872342 RepID=A0ABT5TGA0_9GAMM|nr:KpsF/GutQ family sugar-phosphate isomerase [Shewanella metallivivens]MDD8057637.1 KpsF/GutQ family sugar-phosphate isomerase [Shewanella metallivivens]